MSFLSGFFYFISHHGFLFALCLMAFSIVLAYKFWKIYFIIAAFILSVINAFTGQFLNAMFLNAFGTRSIAVITQAVQTNSTLNDQYIYDYDFIVQKTDGSYVKGTFSTTTASIYPITNAINIPETGKKFPVKYIPGFEKNIVILFNETDDARSLKRADGLSTINKMRIQYETSPEDRSFKQDYIDALERFIRDNKDQDVSIYENQLRELKNTRY
jgi:hypothetical protein